MVGARMISTTVEALANYWRIPDNPPSAPDCFVIPSYAVVDETRPTRPTCAQIELAHEWWQRFPSAVMIMSTGDNQRLGVPNSTVMANYATQLGVPPDNVIEEDRSLNTLENLRYSGEIIEDQGFVQPTLVTIDVYTRRAVATASKLGWRGFYWLSAYSEGEPAYGWKRFQTRSRTSLLFYELGASIYSRLVGWT